MNNGTDKILGNKTLHISVNNICDGGVITDDNGRVVSPVESDGNYPNNLECVVNLQAPLNKVHSFIL